MSIRIQKIDPHQYIQYDQIPNWFTVKSILEIEIIEQGLGGFQLQERSLAEPYIKHYDITLSDGLKGWAEELDLSNWGIFVAFESEQPIGGISIAPDPKDVFPFDNFNLQELAVVWDVRVHPDHRRKGLGSALLDHAANWARGHGYTWLGLETSNINVPACKLYASKGCELGAIHRYGYAHDPQVAHEVMLLWYWRL